MIADYNLKALVFDDIWEEAKPLIDALNYERIPNIYINFETDSNEDKKVKNIRLVFTDLLLETASTGNEENKVEPIRSSILTNIDDTNGPFILVVWSKHIELTDTLVRRLKEGNEKLNFITIQLNKEDYFNQISVNKWELKSTFEMFLSKIKSIKWNNNTRSIITFNIQYKILTQKPFEVLKNDINIELGKLDYLSIFLEWEKDARATISQVLNNFLEDISDNEKIKNTLSSTIKSTLGEKTEGSHQQKLNAFYRTLNKTLSDSIENSVSPTNKYQVILDALELKNLDDNLKAEINTKVLFEKCSNNDIKTGNIYCAHNFMDNFYGDVIKDVCGYDNNILKEELYLYKKKECKKTLEEEHVNEDNCYEELEKNTRPILMEFTPACDIANDKYKKSRLIFGYLVDSRYTCLEKESESLYITKFHFKYMDVNYKLAFFIKHIFAVNPEKIRNMTPLIRARKEFATDLQHSIANHISRIGVSSLDL